MKKKVLHSFAFLVIGMMLLFGLHRLSNHVDPIYPVQKHRMQKFLENAGKIEAVTVGNSLNRAIDFGVLGMRGFHLWEPGSDFFEVEYRLRALVPLMPALKVVLIPIGPTNFYLDNTLIEIGEGRRRDYYAITPGLRSFVPVKRDFRNLVLGKLSGVVRRDHWRGFFEVLLFDEHRARDRVNIEDFIGDDGNTLKTRIKESTDRRAVKRATRRVMPGQEARFILVMKENPRIAEDVYETLYAITEYLQARGVRPIFYTPPITEYFGAKLRKSENLHQVYEKTLDYMQQLTEETGTEYYNFAKDREFIRNYDFFIDHAHLNIYGAEAFCRKFFAQCGLPVVPNDSLVTN